MNFPFRLFASISLLLIAITGCLKPQVNYPPLLPDAKPGEYTSIRDTYRTELADFPADYGTIRVPLRNEQPSIRFLNLHFLRIPAQEPGNRAPIFYLGGGPGTSNLTHQPFPSLVEKHDLVMVGYRGVDDDAPLMCLQIQEAILGAKDNLRLQSIDRLAAAFSNCAQTLAGHGIEPLDYSLREISADIEAVRRALGYDRIHLLGEGFGARIAIYYAQTHAQIVESSVLLAPILPGGLAMPPGPIDSVLARYAGLWVQSEATNSRLPLREQIARAMATLPPRWLLFPIDAGKVRVAAQVMLAHRHAAVRVLDAFSAAAQRDYSGMAVLTFAYDMQMPNVFNFADYAVKAVSADYDSSVDYTQFLPTDERHFGSPQVAFVWGGLQRSAWPKQRLPVTETALRLSPVPTLVLSGSLDPVAPAALTESRLMPFLINGTHVILREAGHTVDLWTFNRGESLSLITGFYNTGQVDTSNIGYQPLDFHAGLRFPTAAKLATGAIAFILLLLFAMVLLFVYRLRGV